MTFWRSHKSKEQRENPCTTACLRCHCYHLRWGWLFLIISIFSLGTETWGEQIKPQTFLWGSSSGLHEALEVTKTTSLLFSGVPTFPHRLHGRSRPQWGRQLSFCWRSSALLSIVHAWRGQQVFSLCVAMMHVRHGKAAVSSVEGNGSQGEGRITWTSDEIRAPSEEHCMTTALCVLLFIIASRR